MDSSSVKLNDSSASFSLNNRYFNEDPPQETEISKRYEKRGFDIEFTKETKADQEKEEENTQKILRRLLKFFLYNTKEKCINLKDGYFCQRREPMYGKVRNPETKQMEQIVPVSTNLILYGIDFKKERDIQNQYKPQSLQYIDSSHVLLKYSDYMSALGALIQNQREEVEENEAKLEETEEVTRKWMEMQPYMCSKYERRVIARYATSQETNFKRRSENDKQAHKVLIKKAREEFHRKRQQRRQIEENHHKRREQIKEERQREYRLRDMSFSYDQERMEKLRKELDDSNFPKEELSFRISDKKEPRERSRDAKRQDSNASFLRSQKSSPIRQSNEEDDRVSMASKSDLGSMLGRLDNLGLDEHDDEVLSNMSFLLDDHESRNELIDRLMMDMESNTTGQSRYSLTNNMPGPKPETQHNDLSFVRDKPFNYSAYMKEQEEKEEEERRKRQESIPVIDLLDED